GCQDLGEAASRAVGCVETGGIVAAGHGCDRLGPRPQSGIRGADEFGLQARVYEEAERTQDEGHAHRRGKRDPHAQRKTHHGVSRYPAPRTVSMDRVPNGRSIFSRKIRTYTSTMFESPSRAK